MCGIPEEASTLAPAPPAAGSFLALGPRRPVAGLRALPARRSVLFRCMVLSHSMLGIIHLTVAAPEGVRASLWMARANEATSLPISVPSASRPFFSLCCCQ